MSELDVLVLKHAGAGGHSPGRQLEVGTEFDSDGEVYLEIIEGLDVPVDQRHHGVAWVSRRQVRKLRDHLNKLLEQKGSE